MTSARPADDTAEDVAFGIRRNTSEYAATPAPVPERPACHWPLRERVARQAACHGLPSGTLYAFLAPRAKKTSVLSHAH